MPGVVREGDLSSGTAEDPSSPWPKTAVTVPNNSTVYANSKLVATKGGSFATHNKGGVFHFVNAQRVITGGSGTVFAEGKAIARSGDKVADGDECDQSSSDVFAG
jgi:uncharacterized Zn-binding protein involved in type VI secretion